MIWNSIVQALKDYKEKRIKVIVKNSLCNTCLRANCDIDDSGDDSIITKECTRYLVDKSEHEGGEGIQNFNNWGHYF